MESITSSPLGPKLKCNGLSPKQANHFSSGNKNNQNKSLSVPNQLKQKPNIYGEISFNLNPKLIDESTNIQSQMKSFSTRSSNKLGNGPNLKVRLPNRVPNLQTSLPPRINSNSFRSDILTLEEDYSKVKQLVELLAPKIIDDDFYKVTVPKLDRDLVDQNLGQIYEHINTIYQIKKSFYSMRLDKDSEIIENLILDLILSIRPKIEEKTHAKEDMFGERSSIRKQTRSTHESDQVLDFNTEKIITPRDLNSSKISIRNQQTDQDMYRKLCKTGPDKRNQLHFHSNILDTVTESNGHREEDWSNFIIQSHKF